MALGVDNFNSYAIGDLTGTNGGSGWSAAWSGDVAFDVTTNTPQEGANCVEILSDTVDRRINRTITGVSTGIQSIYMRISGTAGMGDCGHNDGANTNAAQRTAIRFGGDGQICQFFSAYSCNNLQAYNANQWYQIEIDFDASTDDYRVRVDGGTWGIRKAFVNTVSDTLDRVDMHKTDVAGATWRFDNITDTTPVTATGRRFTDLLLLGVG